MLVLFSMVLSVNSADNNKSDSSVQLKIKTTRLAIESLGKQFSDYPVAQYLEELGKLELQDAKDAEIETFRYKALVLNNPVVKFDKIIFRSTKNANMPYNWRGNSHYLRTSGSQHKPRFYDELKSLDLKKRTTQTIFKGNDPREFTMDLCLSYDAKKLLYSGVDLKSNTSQIFEMNIDGSETKRITPVQEAIDNYNAVYLPNGKLIFCSTASLNAVPCVGGKDYVGTLFEINQDGSAMRQVAFDQENDWYPWVKDNGRVMYSRWEYTDNSHYFTRILMEMNPDGTNNRSIYGSNSFWPNTMFYAKQIPGHTNLFCAIVSGHHGVARAGELIVFDTNKGDFEADGAVQRITQRGKKIEPVIKDNYMSGKWPRFLHPYPLSKDFFLVSAQLNSKQKWGLYLVDTYDNVIKLMDSDRHLLEPIPVFARKRPPVIPDKRRPDSKEATLFIQDIYAGPGLKGIPRGTVKALRIFTYGYAYRLTGGHDALAIEGGWDTKRVLGTVPVEKDGSVMVTVPASLPLSIQPLDEKGQALQIMRSWLAAQPGEVVACIGCHEPSNMAPLTSRCIAATKAPQKLTSWSKHGRLYGFGFNREIQPILDRYCVGCHDGNQKNGINLADTRELSWRYKSPWSDFTRHFPQSYIALHPYVRRPGPESDMHLLTPMDFHASTSELIQMLNKGHHGVKLDKEAYKQLITWIDLNVPCHSTWLEENSNKHLRAEAERTKKFKKLYSDIDDDIEWMPATAEKRPEFVKPELVVRSGPTIFTLRGWPHANKKVSLESKKVKIGNKEITMVKVPKGQFVMGSSNGALDEEPQEMVKINKPFWISTTEITNEQFRQFNPDHDSKVIDQQAKDHIFPGYPANKPEMPVIRVTWSESMDFCKWLSKKTGMKVNLPTEAQWEWSARAGSDKPWPFGSTGFEQYANLADQSIALLAVTGVNPKPVPASQRTFMNDFVPRDNSFNDGRLLPDGTAQYNANNWGLYDMIGNVCEWTRSSYKPYPYNENDGRNDMNPSDQKVARGGSWRDRPKTATVSYRRPYAPFQKVFNVGFRIVIEE